LFRRAETKVDELRGATVVWLFPEIHVTGLLRLHVAMGSSGTHWVRQSAGNRLPPKQRPCYSSCYEVETTPMGPTTQPAERAPTDLTREWVLSRCRYFAAVGLWPTVGDGFDPEGWLRNFEPQEERHALYLLNGYLYFSRRIIDRLFIEALHSLCAKIADPSDGPTALRARWMDFVRTALVVPVRGERPNPSDSGAIFVRRARDLIAIDEKRLLEPVDAARTVEDSPDLPIVFVDDFLGTGNQMLSTWLDRTPSGGSGVRQSYADLSQEGFGKYYYCPIVATVDGIRTLTAKAPALTIRAAHVLPDHASVFAPESLAWPAELASTAEDFVRTASDRAKIPNNPASTTYWKGYRGLGLMVGFEHGVPDATLPILYWNQNGWTPLWRV
jgi:hypothetical protein